MMFPVLLKPLLKLNYIWSKIRTRTFAQYMNTFCLLSSYNFTNLKYLHPSVKWTQFKAKTDI